MLIVLVFSIIYKTVISNDNNIVRIVPVSRADIFSVYCDILNGADLLFKTQLQISKIYKLNIFESQ